MKDISPKDDYEEEEDEQLLSIKRYSNELRKIKSKRDISMKSKRINHGEIMYEKGMNMLTDKGLKIYK